MQKVSWNMGSSSKPVRTKSSFVCPYYRLKASAIQLKAKSPYGEEFQGIGDSDF